MMKMRRFEKVVLTLVSLLLVAVLSTAAYLFFWQNDDVEQQNILRALSEQEVEQESSATAPSESSEIALQGPLTLPEITRPRPAVASVDLDSIWAEIGYRDIAGLSSDPDLSGLEIRYDDYRVPLAFQTLRLPSPDLAPGTEYVSQQGQAGVVVVTTRNVYSDGELIESEEISSLVETAMVNEIIYYGEETSVAAELIAATTAMIAETEATLAATEAPLEAAAELVQETPPAESETETTALATATGNYVKFVPATGQADSVYANHEILQANGILGSAGRKTLYTSFEDHGTYITVNGVNVPYASKMSKYTTSYDGLECCKVTKDHNPPINHNTASGVPANIGLCASNEYPFGTVLFVEEYGFCIVADRHGNSDPSTVDVCYAAGEVWNYDFGAAHRNVYLISIPPGD